MTLTPGLTFTDLRVVSTERLQQVWHASRERLSFRTPGSVPPFGDLLMLQLLRPVSPNLPCHFSTFHLDYPWYFLDFACYLCTFVDFAQVSDTCPLGPLLSEIEPISTEIKHMLQTERTWHSFNTTSVSIIHVMRFLAISTFFCPWKRQI